MSAKKVEVGQTVVFAKPQFRAPTKVMECKVLKVGRLYFTLNDHRRYPTKIRIENFEEADCDNNRGRVFLSMEEYTRNQKRGKAITLIRQAIHRKHTIFDNVDITDLLKVAELLGIDMSEMGDSDDQ